MEVILSGFIGAVIGAVIAGYATFYAIERNRKKQFETEFMTRNYLRLVNALREESNGRPQEGYEYRATALDEIQLLGDEDLARSAREVCIAAGRKGSEEIWGKNLDKLHTGLRSRLREELDKDIIEEAPMHISYRGPKKSE